MLLDDVRSTSNIIVGKSKSGGSNPCGLPCRYYPSSFHGCHLANLSGTNLTARRGCNIIEGRSFSLVTMREGSARYGSLPEIAFVFCAGDLEGGARVLTRKQSGKLLST